jgi:AmmeMemoRadiSam system protein A
MFSSEPVDAAPAAVAESDGALLARHGPTLLALAGESIEWFARTGAAMRVDAAEFPPSLRARRAVFVTLTLRGELRGCVGSPVAWRHLVEDVAENAVAAAFEDRRFAPLAGEELDGLAIAISLLGPPAPLAAASEAELLAQLRPGRDGLILRDHGHQSLFLPQVWRHLPEPADFLAQLRRKAGLPPDHWSPGLRFQRFTATSVAQPGAEE